MDLLPAFQLLIASLAVGCLWMARVAWREASKDPFPLRAVGPLLWTAAAAVMLYGLAIS